MACSSVTLAGIELGCKDSMGGIDRVYLNRSENVSSYTETSDVVTAITLVDDAPLFQTYRLRRDSSSLTSTFNTDEAAGSASYTNDLALQFTKLETTKRIEIQALAQDELDAIVKDHNGKYWLVTGVTASAGTAVTGQATTDLNGYTLTLSGVSTVLPVEVSESALTATVIA